MKPRDLGWPPKAMMDDALSEALDEGPEEVAKVLAAIVNRCKADGRYAIKEIEAAAEQVCRELGIAREWQAIRSKKSAGLQ